MKILELVDQLDDLLRKARPVPLTDQVRVDREAVYSIIDEMRVEIPELIRQARQGQAAASATDQPALTEAVSAAIRTNIPEIARALAAESARGRRPDAPPPGGPF